MSAEDVLKAAAAGNNMFGNLTLTPGGIRQGILTAASRPSGSTSSSGLGLADLLRSCQQEGVLPAGQSSWMAVVITKTPETVVVLLPSTQSQSSQSSSSQSSSLPYIIIDSHPRPGVVESGGGAYARMFLNGFDDLVAHLTTILPATELGPDIPEMMAVLYNSFDLYPLVFVK